MTLNSQPTGFGDGAHLLGHRVVDEHHNKIGKVTDVLFDDMTGTSQWAIVDLGFMRSERFVPLNHGYYAEDGDVVVPVSKDLVKHSPKAARHTLSGPEREDLEQYYGLAA